MKKPITILAAMAAFSTFTHAAVITFENYTFTGSEADENGRLNRNGVISAWGSAKSLSGKRSRVPMNTRHTRSTAEARRSFRFQ